MRRSVILSTILWVFFFSQYTSSVAQAQAADGQYDVPQFRVVADGAAPDVPPGTEVRLVTDEDFAPYSFLSTAGAPAGLAVELAIAACEQAKLHCTVETKPFGEILETLTRGGADAAITGPRLDEDTLKSALITRPYFRIMGRFATLAKSGLTSPDPQGLSGKKIAVVKDTVHAEWLKAYYSDSKIVLADNWAAAGESVRKGEADALFGDNLQTIYWVAGEASAACCKLLGGAFSDFDYFSRNLAFLVRRDHPEIRAALDYGLDQAQASGLTAKIIRTYIPLNPW